MLPVGRDQHMIITPNVVDLYHLDSVTSFKTAATAGILGVIHKATTGATGKDAKYASRRQPALDAGLLWGAYHWGTHANVADQVKNFLKTAAPDENTLVALDFEKTAGNQMTLAQAREFLTRIEDELGRKAIIYSSNLLKEQLGSSKDAFSARIGFGLLNMGNTPWFRRAGRRSGCGNIPTETRARTKRPLPAYRATRRGKSIAISSRARRPNSGANGPPKRDLTHTEMTPRWSAAARFNLLRLRRIVNTIRICLFTRPDGLILLLA